MTNNDSTPSGHAWIKLARWTAAGTAAALALSLLLNYLLLFSDALTPFGRSMVTAVVLPLVIAGPLCFALALKLQDIGRYRQELNRLATYDTATGCLNGQVFSSFVDRRTRAPQGPRQGAFLVVHAQSLVSINVTHGLGWGEEALRLIASTIRASVRSGDIVGRIGPGDFGVFLPGASEDNARDIGERICASVANAYFSPGGADEQLSVTVGGVFFEKDLGFDDMFRAAEQQVADTAAPGALAIAHFPDRARH